MNHESTPPRPTTTTSSAPVNEQGPSSDPNIALSSRPHESAPDLFTSTNLFLRCSHEANIPPSSSIPSDEFAGGSDVPAGATTGPSADPSNKGSDVNADNIAERMKAYMRTFLKNQSITIYTTGWTMKHVKSFSDDQLKTEFDKIRTAIAELKSQNIRRSLKRPGADLEQANSKKSKSTEAPKSSILDESQQPSIEVPSQKATIEDVEVPSNTASTEQHTASSLKKVGIRKKQLGRKGAHTSHSTIPFEDGDPEAEHKMCIKYASDADYASNDNTPINLYAIVDWELLPTGLGSINVFYRKDNSRKCFTSLREILHLVLKIHLKLNMDLILEEPTHLEESKLNYFHFPGVHVLETVSGLVVHMFVDKKYPLSVNLIERMLDHQLEICHGTVGNELTTAVQLIAFLKK
ncbi:hypothetical protein Tco_0970499 [Tanacetum coccineum]